MTRIKQPVVQKSSKIKMFPYWEYIVSRYNGEKISFCKRILVKVSLLAVNDTEKSPRGSLALVLTQTK